jgi:uncharacterized protein DUF4124
MTRRSTPMTRHTIPPVLAVVLCAVTAVAHAEVYKCQDAAGRTIYGDAPCARGGKPLDIPSDAAGGAPNGSVCAQLLDERRRLAAEAERSAKRGRPESAASAKRRQSLAQQYARRCAGISKG